MIQLVTGVHGWNERDKGEGSVGSFRPWFIASGIPYLVHKHHWPRLRSWALLAQRRRTREEAERLAESLQSGQGLVTFSNGAPVARHALLQRPDVEVSAWVAIAPALRPTIDWPENVKRITVLHSPGDRAVIWGGRWTWFWPWADDWGPMGATGARTDDPRVENWPARKDIPHSGWFNPEPLSYWAPKIVQAFDS